MSDCPNSRHLLITRPEVLKARIGSAFSKIPKWVACEVIVPFVSTRFLRHAPPLSPEHHDKLDFGFLLVPLGAAIAGLTRLRISYSAYIWTSVVFFSCWGVPGSIPRFDLVIFPLFIVLALIGARSRAFHLGYVVASSMLAALFMVMHSQWNWVA